jgi:hypothetical protein
MSYRKDYDKLKWKQIASVGFEFFKAMTTKNAVFWYVKFQFVPQRGHITSTLQGPAG